ncbi:hypothetical protein P5E47_03185 [Clostridium perfringens]|nr:hypothetical protein [Clostridium perfringens]MDK0804054.1 hypothetical protein [Clostridium perfringens]
MENTNFNCFRYSIISFDQGSFFEINDDEKARERLMSKILEANNEVTTKRKKNQYKTYLVKKLNETLYMLQFGKKTIAKHPKDTGEKFIDENIIEYPYIILFVDIEKQIILFETKTSIFKDSHAAASAFSIFINEQINVHNLELNLEQITEKNDFWSLKNELTDIKEIKLTLISPNLFGGNTSAEETAREFEKATNSTSSTIIFKNDKGNLNPKKGILNTFIEYISCGAGSWSLKGRNNKKEKYKTYSSSDKPKQIPLPKEIETQSTETTLNSINKVMNKLNCRPGEDDFDEDSKKD